MSTLYFGDNITILRRSALTHMLQEHDAALIEAGKDGIVMSYTGRAAPWQIIRQVKPKLCKIIKKYSAGDEKSQCENEIWDGENLSAMVTLYKYRGQVDLILTDPPYNTGEDFRYNDKWDKDPNDPDLGELVPKDDGSRHSKWLKFMTPRIWIMREMLKPGGVIAVCIDHRELYRLGMLMDEIFKEENRIGIINWQKSYSPRSDNKGLSTATEYGHSQAGINELDAVVGKGHDFKTVKPLRLIKKVIQIWCRSDGIVLDPFAGSGTTGQAILELNQEANASRRFILIEQGNTEKGDHYARSLTAERVRRVVSGTWASGKRAPVPGGFRFIELKREKIDAEAVNTLAREEMIDLLLTSYWDKTEKAKSYLRRLPAGQHRYLFAVNTKDEGFFLIWDSPVSPSILNRDAFKGIVEEARAAGLACVITCTHR